MTSIDLYRIFVFENNKDRFCDLLMSIRPEDSKIQFIGPDRAMVRFDVAISEEELAFLKLGVPFAMKESWIQQWPSK